METPRQKLIRQARTILGGGKVQVELSPDHFDLAVDLALARYRQRSSHAVDEKLSFLELQEHQVEYVLPNEVIEVKKLYRRGPTGTTSGSGQYFDPFGAAFVNQMGLGLTPSAGGLLTFDLYSGYKELVGRMFGEHINFIWNPASHTLNIIRDIRSPETVLMHFYTQRPEEILFDDPYARPWLFDYTVARSKIMLGEIRGKFQSIVGPQGGTTLNGDALKAEGLAEIERLENELINLIDQDIGYGFTIG